MAMGNVSWLWETEVLVVSTQKATENELRCYLGEKLRIVQGTWLCAIIVGCIVIFVTSRLRVISILY